MSGRPSIIEDTDAIAARVAEPREEHDQVLAGASPERTCNCLYDTIVAATGVHIRVHHPSCPARLTVTIAHYGSLADELARLGLRIEPANTNTSRSNAG